MSLLQPKYPIISPIRTSVKDDPEGFLKELNEKIELLRQNANAIYDETGAGMYKPKYGQFHSITKQDLTTAWSDVANLVTSANVTDEGLSTTGTNIAFAETGIYKVCYSVSFANTTSAVEVGVIHANKTPSGGAAAEITGSYSSIYLPPNLASMSMFCDGSFLVDITNTGDTIHFEVSGNSSTLDMNASAGAESVPTTRNIFNCTIIKIANT